MSVPALVAYAYLFANSAAHLNPEGTFMNAVQDSNSSFKMTFRQVDIKDMKIENCSGWVVASAINSSWSVWFGPSNFTQGPNLTLGVQQASPAEKAAEWQRVNFTIYYSDVNNNSLVYYGDVIRVVCTQPLHQNEKYNI